MVGSHDGEVTTINCRNRGDVEPLGCGDHRGVNGAQRQVAVLVHHLGDSKPVSGRYWFHAKVAARQITQQLHFCASAEPGPDQVGDFGYDQRWNQKWFRIAEQKVEACLVMSIIRIDVCIERASVNNQSDGATSLARISSMRSEISLRPLRPAAAAPSRRFGLRWSSIASRVSSEIVMPRRFASWRSLASTSSGSLMVVLFMVCQHTFSVQAC